MPAAPSLVWLIQCLRERSNAALHVPPMWDAIDAVRCEFLLSFLRNSRCEANRIFKWMDPVAAFAKHNRRCLDQFQLSEYLKRRVVQLVLEDASSDFALWPSELMQVGWRSRRRGFLFNFAGGRLLEQPYPSIRIMGLQHSCDFWKHPEVVWGRLLQPSGRG